MKNLTLTIVAAVLAAGTARAEPEVISPYIIGPELIEVADAKGDDMLLPPGKRPPPPDLRLYEKNSDDGERGGGGPGLFKKGTGEAVGNAIARLFRPANEAGKKEADRLAEHLFKNGKDAQDLYGRPAKCLEKHRPEGKAGQEVLACLVVKVLDNSIPGTNRIRHAVQRWELGETTLYVEDWEKGKDGSYAIEQHEFRVEAGGGVIDAKRTFYAVAEEGAPPVAVEEPAVLDTESENTIGVFKKMAVGAAKLMPLYKI